MLKIKISVVAVFFVLTGIVLSGSQQFSTSAKGDVLQEIAKYKTWNKITKEPIKFDIDLSVSGG